MAVPLKEKTRSISTMFAETFRLSRQAGSKVALVSDLTKWKLRTEPPTHTPAAQTLCARSQFSITPVLNRVIIKVQDLSTSRDGYRNETDTQILCLF